MSRDGEVRLILGKEWGYQMSMNISEKADLDEVSEWPGLVLLLGVIAVLTVLVLLTV